MITARQKTALRALLLSIGVALTVAVAWKVGWTERLEWLSYDWRMTQFRTEARADDRIAVVLIDDASLRAMESIAGRWPWPRSVYGDLLEFFSFAPPKSIVFDITFTEKQGYGLGDIALLNPHDQRLVDATTENRAVYHAARLILDSEDEQNKALLNRSLPDDFKSRFALENRSATHDFLRNFDDPSSNNYYLPFAELYRAANGIGIVDVKADRDGVYRRARLFHRYHENYFPALSVAPLLDLLAPAAIERQNRAVRFGDRSIPINSDTTYLVNYYGQFNTYSFSGLMASLQQIRQGELENLLVNPLEFEDKIVFIGASAAGLEDLKQTALAQLPGVYLHASIAANLLQRDFLRPASPASTLILILAFAPLTCFGVFYIRKFHLQSAFPLLLGGAYIVWSLYQYQHHVVTELMAPLLAIGLAWAAAFASLLFTEGREKLRFKRMMSQYLSPAVLATVMDKHADIAKAEVGSNECLSILFSDIRSFTSLSETLAAEKVVEMLNHYFSAMTDAIFAHQGTIDKFIGDAIMAFWGAPIRIQDHADKATHAALEMLQRLEHVNAWLRSKGYPAIQIGIGIHTGDVILGNIGSDNKLDYTIIGDNVNLASRMEGLTKGYDCPLLISEATYRRLTLAIPCRVVDLVRVKGKNVPIRIYHPLGLPESLTIEQTQRLQWIAQQTDVAFSHYLARRWNDALQAVADLPDDRVKAMLRQRCQQYLQQPPPPDWDGVHTMTTK